MRKKQKKLLKIISMVILSSGSIAGTSTALIACNNNKETPFAIKTAIIDSTGTKITLTYDGNIPSDFANNLKVIENTRNLTKDNDWTFDINTKIITLKNIDTVIKGDTLTVEYKNGSVVTATNQSKTGHIASATTDADGINTTITFNGNAPSDFATNTVVTLNDKSYTKDNWSFANNVITNFHFIINKNDNLSIQYKNEKSIPIDTSQLFAEGVALLTTNWTRVNLTAADADKLNTNVALNLTKDNLQRKDISVIVVYNATVANAFALAANENGEDNDNWSNLKTIDLSRSNATSIRQVIHDDPKFNGNIIFPANLTSIGDDFLIDCTGFNQPLTLPNSITSIGDYFLSDCHDAFNQPLTLPNSITSIGDNFLAYCGAFNQPLTLPNSITSIVNSFLYDCAAFNQPLTLPNSITSIGDNFLAYCGVFNQPLTLPNNLNTIGNWFLIDCYAFNQPFIIPNSVSKIGFVFLYDTDIIRLTISAKTVDGISYNDKYQLPSLYQHNENVQCHIFGDGADALIKKFPKLDDHHRDLVKG